MRDKEVVFTGKTIYLKNNNRSIVMDSASKSLMDMYSYVVCQNGGNVLDVGFGMGFSANKMSELANHYTCIEINPQIYEKALEWARGKLNVTIIFGDWIDIIPSLTEKFDGIFMDTHDDSNYIKFEEYCKLIANKGCILSIFNYFSLRNTNELNNYEFKLETHKFSKLVTPSHNVSWTTYINNNFIKSSSVIKFQKPTKVI
tara:strand:+ start:2540 stop:3142 length:603 start_codon:yes stop_codon:yes gene_type:complete